VLPVVDTRSMQAQYVVDVRQPAPFLRRVMRDLAGAARLSLEGNLGDAAFPAEAILSRDSLDILKRNTTEPGLDFVVLRLEPELVDAMFSLISRIGLREDIVHVQIEKDGRLELAAYDNFHPQCVVTGPAIAARILAELQAAGVVRAYASTSR